jgi:hypothetical protein
MKVLTEPENAHDPSLSLFPEIVFHTALLSLYIFPSASRLLLWLLPISGILLDILCDTLAHSHYVLCGLICSSSHFTYFFDRSKLRGIRPTEYNKKYIFQIIMYIERAWKSDIDELLIKLKNNRRYYCAAIE